MGMKYEATSECLLKQSILQNKSGTYLEVRLLLAVLFSSPFFIIKNLGMYMIKRTNKQIKKIHVIKIDIIGYLFRK
uniref:Uncharacterized protein n=1 Tax=Halalkalibacterium halodurans TaxID=86665 RepID=A0A0M0KKE3_ALKHA